MVIDSHEAVDMFLLGVLLEFDHYQVSYHFPFQGLHRGMSAGDAAIHYKLAACRIAGLIGGEV